MPAPPHFPAKPVTLPNRLSPSRSPSRRAAFAGLLVMGLLLPAIGTGAAEAGPRERQARTLRLSSSEMQALQRWLCPHGGRPLPGRPGRCDGRGSRLASGPGRGGDDGVAFEWFQGLPPARRQQLACPEGTRPVLARGHADTLRCLPG